jgi:hypothetical protein
VGFQLTLKLPAAGDGHWPAMTRLAVGCMACQFDRQVCGNEIEFTYTRRRPIAVLPIA